MKKILLPIVLLLCAMSNAQICYERINSVVFSPIANSTDLLADIKSDCCDIHQFNSYTVTSNGNNHVINLCYLDTGLLMPSTITSSIVLTGLNTSGDQNFTLNSSHHFNTNWPNPIDCNSSSNAYVISPVSLTINAPLTESRTFLLSESEFSLKKTSLYPNPNSGNFSLQVPSDEQAQVTITDLSGKIVFSIADYSSGNPIQLKGLSKGLYLAKVICNQSTEILKFIVH